MRSASGDDVDDGGLVFISYSHVDVAWAQRFRVLLKPLVRRKHLQLWYDTHIRVGDEWHPAIEDAIRRSGVNDSTARIWNPSIGAKIRIDVIRIGVRAVAWSPDGRLLATSSDNVGAGRSSSRQHGCRPVAPTVAPSRGEPMGVRDTGHAGTVHSVAWSPDGAHLVTADDTGLVIVWDRQLNEVASLQLNRSRCVAWNAPLIAVGQPGGPALLALCDPTDLDR